MRHKISLFVSLFALWCLLSGMFVPMLIGLGIVSCLLVTWIAERKDLVDNESLPPLSHWGRWFSYAIWLLWQIIVCNIDVARRIWRRQMPISPTIIRVPARMGPLARVIYANSITLTPGTVSIEVDEDTIEVHALTRESAQDLQGGEMGRRVFSTQEKQT